MPIYVSASLIRLEDADAADRMALTAEAEGAASAATWLRTLSSSLRAAAALDRRALRDDDATPVREVNITDRTPTTASGGLGRPRRRTPRS